MAEDGALALWLMVVASGLYHGLNPGMGWPLAVSAGLMNGGRAHLLRALGPLALGHFAAMLAVLLPFAAMAAAVRHQEEIRLAAAWLLVAAGAALMIWRRHPRALARIPPHRLALWSFAVAIAHGAGLMLLPAYMGLCATDAGAEGAASTLVAGTAGVALLVAVVHACAMIAAGGATAVLVYEWLGLQFLRRAWFDLSFIWGGSLFLVGVVSIVF
jgi:hypothetical protein